MKFFFLSLWNPIEPSENALLPLGDAIGYLQSRDPSPPLMEGRTVGYLPIVVIPISRMPESNLLHVELLEAAISNTA